MWSASRSQHLTFHLIPNVTNTQFTSAYVCFCHGFSVASVNPQSHIRCDNWSCFSIDAVEKTSTITLKNTVTSVVRRAGRSTLFTCGLHVDVDVIAPCCVQQKEGCGTIWSAGGSTSSNPLVFTLWPTCMNSAYDTRGTICHIDVCVWQLVLDSSSQGDRNRNRNCSRVSVSTDVTKDISLWLRRCSLMRTTAQCFCVGVTNNHAWKSSYILKIAHCATFK